MIIGHEFAGVVDTVGSAVTEFAHGDSVYGFTMDGGAAAEYLLLKEAETSKKCAVAKMPPSLSFVEACGLATAGQTGIESLRLAEAEIPGGLKGKTVFITGGLNGTGSLFVQMAKNVYGAGKVITTVSTNKVPRVPELLGKGVVDQVVDYMTQDVVKEIGKESVDFMLDTIFVAMSYIAVMKPKSGVVFTITGKSGDSMKIDFPDAPWLLLKVMNCVDGMYKWRAGRWNVKYDHVVVKTSQKDLDLLSEWVEAGKVRPVVGRTEMMLDIEKVREMLVVSMAMKGGLGRFVINLE